MPFHLLKQLFHGIEHDARALVIADHRVSLACASVTVAKYGRVEAIECALAQKLGCISEYFLLRCSIIKGEVKGILFFFSSVTPKDLLFVQNVRRVHQDDDIAIEDLHDTYLATILLLLPHGPKSDGHQDLGLSLLHFLNVIICIDCIASSAKMAFPGTELSGTLGTLPTVIITVVSRYRYRSIVILPGPLTEGLRLRLGVGVRQILTIIHFKCFLFLFFLS
jgi:hypothetical protein